MNSSRVVQAVVLTIVLSMIASSSFSAEEGDLNWSQRYRGDTTASIGRDSSWCTPVTLRVDRDGFVIVGGSARGRERNNVNIAILKFDSAGEMVWARQWDGPAGREDLMHGMSLDDCGNIYATGSSTDSDGVSDCITLMYGPNGDLKGERRYDGYPHGSDRGSAIVVGSSGDVYVVGTSDRGVGKKSDWLILCYDSLGTKKWQQNYGSAGEDGAYQLSITSGGGLYVAGSVYDESTLTDGRVAKFDSLGELMWAKGFSSPGPLQDSLVSFLVTVDQKVILIGKAYPYEERTDSDININEWDSSPAFQWVRNFGGEGKLDDVPAASLVDDSGFIYVTALTESFPGSFDVLTMKLAPHGLPIWKRVYAGADGGFDAPRDMKLDCRGNVHVLVKSPKNAALLAYSPHGDLLAKIDPDFGVETFSNDGPIALVVDQHGYRYVLVQNQGDFVVGKFRPL